MKTQQTKPAKPLNIRQERFAEHVVSGMSDVQAYIAAGYTKSQKNAEANAWRVKENEGVKSRIAELRRPETGKAVLTKDKKLEWLAKFIETPIGEIGPDSPFCSEYTRETVAGGARGKLKRGKAASGNETVEVPVIRERVKMSDKLRAIELHSKLAGDFAPEQVVIEAGPKTLDALEARAKEVVSALDRNAGQK